MTENEKLRALLAESRDALASAPTPEIDLTAWTLHHDALRQRISAALARPAEPTVEWRTGYDAGLARNEQELDEAWEEVRRYKQLLGAEGIDRYRDGYHAGLRVMREHLARRLPEVGLPPSTTEVVMALPDPEDR
jgi:hypothetical protein